MTDIQPEVDDSPASKKRRERAENDDASDGAAASPRSRPARAASTRGKSKRSAAAEPDAEGAAKGAKDGAAKDAKPAKRRRAAATNGSAEAAPKSRRRASVAPSAQSDEGADEADSKAADSKAGSKAADSKAESKAADSKAADAKAADSKAADSRTESSETEAEGQRSRSSRGRGAQRDARRDDAQARSRGEDADADAAGDDDSSDGDSDGDSDEGRSGRTPDPSAVAQHASKMSDRAIQRVVGGNAFLRGRQYARRGDVMDVVTDADTVRGRVRAKQDTFEPKLTISGEGAFASSCSCAAFRGPTGHCKHVAALLVALRDRERPPRPKPPQQEAPPPPPKASDVQAGAPHTVSVGGKRRRSRRRRRGAEAPAAGAIEVLAAREPIGSVISGGPPPERGMLEQWLPGPDDQTKPYDLEYRMQVRAASITITPIIAGTRTAVPISDALASFAGVPIAHRGLMRTLSRHAARNSPTTAELRAEDAAEVLSMLRSGSARVLLEPASMELRFQDDALRPRIELDLASGKSCRVRVVFESKNGVRRFPLSSGAWFEGTPGWHLDTTEGIARPVHDAVTPAWLQRLYRSPALVYSLGDLPRLLSEFVPKVAASLGAELPDLANVADLVDAAPKLRMQADGDIIEARVKLSVSYAEESFPIPPASLPSPLAFLPPDEDGDNRPRVVRRDVGGEMAAVQRLLSLGFSVDEAQEGLIAQGEAAIAFWTEGITTLPEAWEKLIPDDLRAVKVRSSAVAASVRVSSGVDWLSVDMSFSAGGVAVDQDELRACLEKGRHLVKLSDGSFAPVEVSEVSEVLARMAEIVAGQSGAKLPLSQAGRVQDLLRLVGNHSVTPAAKELFGKLGEIGEIEQIAKPRSLKVAQFRDYQKRGFSWLVFLHGLSTGGILADDMGLGKTLQTIALIVHLKSKSKGHKPSLVVAPTSVVPNWAREIEKFAPTLKTLIWQGPDRHDDKHLIEACDVMITSYALLRRDEEMLNEQGFAYVILDEAQHIKNPLSATARAAKHMASDRRLALTGTPIENRLSEIWSIMDFVSPGLLGSLKVFEERYARPIERGDQETAEKLRQIIRPFVLRRTKSQVAPELPSKIEQEMIVPLADEQSKLYRQVLNETRKAIMSEVEKQGVAKAQIQILAALTRLRQVACDPRLMKMKSGEWTDDTSGKLGALRELLAEAKAGGHRVLLFSQFVEMLKLIREALEADGITYEYLDGSTKDRQERVDRFNNDESVDAFLISLKAGGTGLNLTGADTVVHFDPWWNPAVEDQATDRAHRIGQTKVVTVYRLIAKGTVEEKILQLSEKKRELVSNVLSTEGSPLKGLSKADVDELFSD